MLNGYAFELLNKGILKFTTALLQGIFTVLTAAFIHILSHLIKGDNNNIHTENPLYWKAYQNRKD